MKTMKQIKDYILVKIDSFNDYLADKLSYMLATMAMFYIITLLVLIPLLYSQPTSFVAWASYVCSVIFQGVALPVLGYTARKSSDKSDKIIGAMSATTDRIEHMIEQMEKQQDQMTYIISMVEQQEEHISTDVDVLLDLEKKEQGMI